MPQLHELWSVLPEILQRVVTAIFVDVVVRCGEDGLEPLPESHVSGDNRRLPVKLPPAPFLHRRLPHAFGLFTKDLYLG